MIKDTHNEDQPLVSIRCLVYNHEDYIRDTLEGFVNQKTSFKFEAIVHDDASTDRSQSIIKEYADKYPDIIKPILEVENQYSKHDGSLRNIVNSACKGKYYAYCEGDDYWKDPYKLQKQIDFLERHPQYSMCCTNASILSGDKELDWKRFDETCDISIERMISGGGSLISTCTQVYRKEVIETYDKLDFCLRCAVGDYPLQILSTLLGKVHYIHEKTSVYRYQAKGSWTIKSQRTPILKQLDGWKSQIVMLQGLDGFSKGRYHRVFVETEIGLVDWLCRTHISDYKAILNGFRNLIKLPFIYKLSYFFKAKENDFLYRTILIIRKYYMRIFLKTVKYKLKK